MPLTTARSGVCPKCDSKHTNILTLTLRVLDVDDEPNSASFACPICRCPGTLNGGAGYRIVGVKTLPYRYPLGR